MLHIPASRMAICLVSTALMPFVVAAICLWLVAPAWQTLFADALKIYGSVFLAFLGGIHWGGAIEGDDHPSLTWRYIYSLCPAALAVVALACPPAQSLFLLFLGYMTTMFVDRRIYAHETWLIKLRAVMSVIICVCLYASYKALQQF